MKHENIINLEDNKEKSFVNLKNIDKNVLYLLLALQNYTDYNESDNQYELQKDVNLLIDKIYKAIYRENYDNKEINNISFYCEVEFQK